MDKQLYNSFLSLQEAFRASRPLVLAGAGKAPAAFKSDQTPVTDTDVAVEKFLVDHMKQRFPDIPTLGEEGGYDDRELPSTCWLIDPIDGTKSYVQNVPAFTGMAVLLHDGNAVASIIYNPTTDSMYSAETGKGAYKNNTRLELQQTSLPSQVFCKRKILEPLTKMMALQNIKSWVAPSGAGYGFIQVVDGESAARFHLHSGRYIHDHAPGALLVREAGGDIIPVLDNIYTFRTRSFVACHPELSGFVREQLTAIRAMESPQQAVS